MSIFNFNLCMCVREWMLLHATPAQVSAPPVSTLVKNVWKHHYSPLIPPQPGDSLRLFCSSALFKSDAELFMCSWISDVALSATCQSKIETRRQSRSLMVFSDRKWFTRLEIHFQWGLRAIWQESKGLTGALLKVIWNVPKAREVFITWVETW